jgi:hypothetical protein
MNKSKQLLMLNAYALILFLVVFWVYLSLPATCNNRDLINQIRSLLAINLVMIGVYTATSMCDTRCQLKNYDMPNWIHIFTVVFSLASLASLASTLHAIKTADSRCSLNRAHETALGVVILLPCLSMLYSGFMLYQRHRGRTSAPPLPPRSSNPFDE